MQQYRRRTNYSITSSAVPALDAHAVAEIDAEIRAALRQLGTSG